MKLTELCFGISLSTCTDRAVFRNLQKIIPEKKKFLEGCHWELLFCHSLFDEAQRQHRSMFPAQQLTCLKTKELWILYSSLCIFWWHFSGPVPLSWQKKNKHKRSAKKQNLHSSSKTENSDLPIMPTMSWYDTSNTFKKLDCFLNIQDLFLLCLS